MLVDGFHYSMVAISKLGPSNPPPVYELWNFLLFLLQGLCEDGPLPLGVHSVRQCEWWQQRTLSVPQRAPGGAQHQHHQVIQRYSRYCACHPPKAFLGEIFWIDLIIVLFCSPLPVSIQWLRPQWWRSWLGLQHWRLERWKKSFQWITHFSLSNVFTPSIMCFITQSGGRMHVPSDATLQMLCSGSSGDIRSAINSLQFSSLPGQV